MKYLCTNCNYVFDNALGDEEEKIEIGSILDICPICEEYYSFQGIEEEVSYIDDNKRLESVEIDHFPEIEILPPQEGGLSGCSKLKVIVGSEVHPMGIEHRIASVSLYDEYGDLIEMKYLEIEQEPIIEFDFDDLDEFEIRVKCSIHGIWGRKFSN